MRTHRRTTLRLQRTDIENVAPIGLPVLQVLADAGLEADGLERSVRKWLERIGCQPTQGPEPSLRQA